MTVRDRVDTATAQRSFHHAALLYRSRREFIDGSLSFIREGLAGGEPILVVIPQDKIPGLRAELGADADRVQFADMVEVGRNPARIIHRWQRFVDDHGGPGRPVRGIGEPIWPGRGMAELVECYAHETLLNVAFGDGPGWSLLCPYDVAALAPEVVQEARHSHPYLLCDGAEQVSGDYIRDHPSPARLHQPLPPPPAEAEAIAFGPGTDSLRALRADVRHRAERAGLDAAAIERLLLAASEVASNSLCHGGGHGTLRLWIDDGTLICQVDDGGRINGEPLLGRYPAPPHQVHGRGLWLANQVCDLVQIRSGASGTTVRLHIITGAAPPERPARR